MEYTPCITEKKPTHSHDFHTNCSRHKHCRLARHFSLTAKPTEPSECNTRESELPASVCVCVLSVEFHVEAAVRLRRSRGGEQRGRKTTSLPPPQFFPMLIFFPLFSTRALHTLDHGRHIPHYVRERVCAALCSALSAMYNCSGVLLLCQECSQTHRHSHPWHAPTHKNSTDDTRSTIKARDKHTCMQALRREPLRAQRGQSSSSPLNIVNILPSSLPPSLPQLHNQRRRQAY